MKVAIRSLLVPGLVLALLVSGCGGSSTPSSIVKNALMKANQGHYSDANKSISSDIPSPYSTGEFKQSVWDQVTKNGTIQNVEILKEEVRGEGARVHVKIAYKDGSTTELKLRLLKENGQWKIVMSDLIQYQPPRFESTEEP